MATSAAVTVTTAAALWWGARNGRRTCESCAGGETPAALAMVAIFVFLMLRLTPGDPAAVMAGDAATTEQIDRIRQGLGLDGSLPQQYAIWFGQVVTGDLGQSYYYKIPVTTLIGQRLEPTLSLTAITIVIAEEGDEAVVPYANTLIRVPQVPTLLQPLVTTVPLQVFACEMATVKGYDVDQPRNLAKSVTVE